MLTNKPRKVRRDKGLVQATPRDLQVISWIADMYACRQDHLRELLSQETGAPVKDTAEGLIAVSTLKSQMERYKRAGWIEYERYLAKEPAWAWVTKRGLQLVGLDEVYIAKMPSATRYRHIRAVNEVRLHWWANEEEEDEGEWVSERRLRAEMIIVKKHPDHPFAPVRITQGAIPDGIVVGNRWVDAVEIELTPKKPQEMQQKLRNLCRSTYTNMATENEYIYNMIHFYVPNKAMQQHVERACLHLEKKGQERVNITLDESL